MDIPITMRAYGKGKSYDAKILPNGPEGGVLPIPKRVDLGIDHGDSILCIIEDTDIGDFPIVTKAGTYGAQKTAAKIRITKLQMKVGGLEQYQDVFYRVFRLDQ